MKQEFEMSEEEVQAIYDISRNKMPVMMIGSVSFGQDAQENANELWKSMADKYGFVWDSAEASARGDRYFLATPAESKEGRILRKRKELQQKVSDANTAYVFAQQELKEFEESLK